MMIDPKLYHSTHLFYIPSRIYHCSPMDLSRESKTSTNTSEFKESVEMRNASDTKSESLPKVEKARFSKSICNASTSIVQVHMKIIWSHALLLIHFSCYYLMVNEGDFSRKTPNHFSHIFFSSSFGYCFQPNMIKLCNAMSKSLLKKRFTVKDRGSNKTLGKIEADF